MRIADIHGSKFYKRLDVTTTNPRKLFRYMSNILTEKEYLANFNVKLERDEIGDVGAVNAELTAAKKISIKKELDATVLTTILCETFGAGLVLKAIFSENPGLFIPGIILISIGYLIYFKIPLKKTAILTPIFSIYVRGVGEVYRGRNTEKSGEILSDISYRRLQGKDSEKEQIYADISLHIGADYDIPPSSARSSKNEDLEIIDTLKKDFDDLIEEIKKFTEYGNEE